MCHSPTHFLAQEVVTRYHGKARHIGTFYSREHAILANDIARGKLKTVVGPKPSDEEIRQDVLAVRKAALDAVSRVQHVPRPKVVLDAILDLKDTVHPSEPKPSLKSSAKSLVGGGLKPTMNNTSAELSTMAKDTTVAVETLLTLSTSPEMSHARTTLQPEEANQMLSSKSLLVQDLKPEQRIGNRSEVTAIGKDTTEQPRAAPKLRTEQPSLHDAKANQEVQLKPVFGNGDGTHGHDSIALAAMLAAMGRTVVEVPPGKLGLAVRMVKGREGAVIQWIRETSPLWGKARAGDSIVSVDGNQVASKEDLKGNNKCRQITIMKKPSDEATPTVEAVESIAALSRSPATQSTMSEAVSEKDEST